MTNSSSIRKSILHLILLTLNVAYVSGGLVAKAPSLNIANTSVRGNSQLSVMSQLFTHKDCMDYFGVDLIKLGYRPVLFRFKSYSGFPLEIRSSYFEPALVHKHEVMEQLKFSLSWYIGGVLHLVVTYYWKILRVPMIVSLLGMYSYNKTLTKKFENIIFDPEETLAIEPYETVWKVIFFSESTLFSFFTFNVLDTKSNERIPINIDFLHKQRLNEHSAYLPGIVLK